MLVVCYKGVSGVPGVGEDGRQGPAGSCRLWQASGLQYLGVIAVLAPQPHGQLSLGPGTALPQPTHVRGELAYRTGYHHGDDTGGVGGWRGGMEWQGRVTLNHTEQPHTA